MVVRLPSSKVASPPPLSDNGHYRYLRPSNRRGDTMKGARLVCPVLMAALALTCSGRDLRAGDIYNKEPAKQDAIALPKPAEIQSLNAYPNQIALKGSEDAQQILVTATLANNRLQDLTGDMQYEIADSKVARVSTAGRVVPVANGATTITARYGDKAVSISVRAERCDVSLPINFANQIVPIFTKLGCNAGGCHGKASGQNGFKLSLLGFEPDVDYQALVKEARGRRLFPAAPDKSLLLLKATGQVAHGGGRRMEVGSDEYKLVRRWIAAGMPVGDPKDPVVTRIEVKPDHRILTRNNK